MQRTTSSLNAALMAALFLGIVAGQAVASDAPLQCTTDGAGNWRIVAVGPFATTCAGGSECTAIEYDIIPTKGVQPDHVAILADHDVAVVLPESRNVSAPCVGDTVTLLGTRDCSRQAVRINRDAETGFFEMVGGGQLGPIGSSIVVKKGKTIEQCRIASLGGLPAKFDPNAQVSTSQSLNFKGCTLTIPTDPVTGEGGMATIQGDGCAILANGRPINAGELLVDGVSVGNLTYGEGGFSSGVASCTTKVISRKLYTWCTCDDVNGDGIPDDPRPPCP